MRSRKEESKGMRQQFGGRATKKYTSRYAQSGHWDGKKFDNLEETTIDMSFQALPKLLYKQFCDRTGREPTSKLPIIPFNKQAFLTPSEKASFIWYGHSAVLLRVNNATVLIDPMLGSNASPIAPFATKRFSDNTLQLIDDFPDIDMVLLTHDHYDHLDYDSIQKLKHKTKKYFVALGVARHLVQWGIPESDIAEFDWWEQRVWNDIHITFTPTRHFSGRGLTDRAKSLWGGWALRTPTEHLYFSGDSGYGKHFKDIGEKLGGFDFAFMECGQYNELWHSIHMYPEESVQAAIDVQARKIMPVHWAGFSLSLHTWVEPVQRFVAEAKKRKLDYCVPQLGELLYPSDAIETMEWWLSP